MHISAEVFWLPKQGNSQQDYEDAYHLDSFISQDLPVFNCAVADGATETSFADKWAQLLVKAYCQGQLRVESFVKHLSCLQAQWMAQIDITALPWYAEEKVRRGAFSALVGLTLTQNEQCGEVIAVGDSCLFQVSQNKLIHCFPLTHSQQFQNHPVLLSSHSTYNQQIVHHVNQLKIQWQTGDEFYLMTDALACWFFHAYEHQEHPWQILQQLTQEQFIQWIKKLRKTRALVNDDVTLLRIFIQP